MPKWPDTLEPLPKWIIGTDIEHEREFVIHMQAPRIVFEVFEDDEGIDMHWVDDGSELDWDCPQEIKTETLLRAAREARDAYIQYNRKLDEMTDDIEEDW